MTSADCIRVLSVDDHPLLREPGYRRELFIVKKTIKINVQLGSDELTLCSY